MSIGIITTRSALIGLAGAILTVAVFVSGRLPAQTRAAGFPIDWSHRRLVFSDPGSFQQAVRNGRVDKWLKITRNPRFVFQQLERYSASAALGTSSVSSSAATHVVLHRDWNVPLGNGGTVGAGNYPAKYSLTGGASCSDFAVFNTSLTGTTSQATLVALTNLYSTGCSSVPTVAWAYNTTNKIVTSAVLSAAGDQVVFMSTNGTHAYLNILRFESGEGTAYNHPITPDNSLTMGASYSACKTSHPTQSCWLQLEFADGDNDTTSSPFYDYSGTDKLYVGDANGKLHQFTGIFLGSPVETGSPWPVSLSTQALTSPVYDGSTYVFVGSENPGGNHTDGAILYSVQASSGTVNGTSSQLGHGPGIVDSPLVDGTADRVYVSVGNDGSSNCNGNGCSIVVQFPTNFTTGAGTKATVGDGAGSTAGVPMYSGTFDNAYFTSSSSSSPSGGLWVCGNTGNDSNSAGDPVLYKIAIASNVMGAVTTASSLTNAAATCSPVSEIFTNSHDYLFLSVTKGGNRTGCTGDCVYNFDVTTSVPANSVGGFASTGRLERHHRGQLNCFRYRSGRRNILHAVEQYVCLRDQSWLRHTGIASAVAVGSAIADWQPLRENSSFVLPSTCLCLTNFYRRETNKWHRLQQFRVNFAQYCYSKTGCTLLLVDAAPCRDATIDTTSIDAFGGNHCMNNNELLVPRMSSLDLR